MGNVLRVNYRKTGGVSGVRELGAGMAGAIAGTGAGANAGGLMYLPSINGTTYSAGLYVESAYGIMEAYYGTGVYNSGYVVQPLVITPLSFSTIQNTDSIVLGVASMRTSGSLMLFQPYISGVAAASNIGVNYRLLAIVISGP